MINYLEDLGFVISYLGNVTAEMTRSEGDFAISIVATRHPSSKDSIIQYYCSAEDDEPSGRIPKKTEAWSILKTICEMTKPSVIVNVVSHPLSYYAELVSKN